MKKLRHYNTALRPAVREWLETIGDLDILVGIPCFNNEETIGHVVETVGQGLKQCYPEKNTAILVADGGSLDDTREAAERADVPGGISRLVTIYRGVPGKGTSCRAIFEAAFVGKADACAVVDADLRSITPDWVRLLVDPVIQGAADFVAPYYLRHKYDGTITNHIVYPITRALYGKRVRQPIGGDFGFSGDLAAFFARQDVWQTDVARFGIDIWMTTSALAEGHRIVQAHLGVKVHDPKDPAEDLGPMFRQVVSTLFYLLSFYEPRWKDKGASEDVPIWNGTAPTPKLPHVAVTMSKMHQEFTEGFRQFKPLYEMVLLPATFRELESSAATSEKDGAPQLEAELWARILYDFGFVFHTWHRNRRRLVDVLTPLYFGRVASYCREVADLTSKEAEAVIDRQAKVFEDTKEYLREKFRVWE